MLFGNMEELGAESRSVLRTCVLPLAVRVYKGIPFITTVIPGQALENGHYYMQAHINFGAIPDEARDEFRHRIIGTGTARHPEGDLPTFVLALSKMHNGPVLYVREMTPGLEIAGTLAACALPGEGYRDGAMYRRVVREYESQHALSDELNPGLSTLVYLSMPR